MHGQPRLEHSILMKHCTFLCRTEYHMYCAVLWLCATRQYTTSYAQLSSQLPAVQATFFSCSTDLLVQIQMTRSAAELKNVV